VEEAASEAVDLVALAKAGAESGILWTCRTDDLNLNLLAVEAEKPIGEHVNAEVDVLLVGVEGEGVVQIDGEPHILRPGCAVVVPKGSRRSLWCEYGRCAYLTCHRRRAGLWPQGLPRRDPAQTDGG
jgi:quercetin dioxygenase-like cupin family protein